MSSPHTKHTRAPPCIPFLPRHFSNHLPPPPEDGYDPSIPPVYGAAVCDELVTLRLDGFECSSVRQGAGWACLLALWAGRRGARALYGIDTDAYGAYGAGYGRDPELGPPVSPPWLFVTSSRITNNRCVCMCVCVVLPLGVRHSHPALTPRSVGLGLCSQRPCPAPCPSPLCLATT